MTVSGGCTTRQSPAPAAAFSTSASPGRIRRPRHLAQGGEPAVAAGGSAVVHDAGTARGPGRQRDLAGPVRVPRSWRRRLAHVHHRAPEGSTATRRRGHRTRAQRRHGALGTRATALIASRVRADRGTRGRGWCGVSRRWCSPVTPTNRPIGGNNNRDCTAPGRCPAIPWSGLGISAVCSPFWPSPIFSRRLSCRTATGIGCWWDL